MTLKNVLVTGVAGYIGSQTCVELLKQNYSVIGLDNFVNSSKKTLKRIEKIAGKKISFYEVDLTETEKLATVFDTEKIDLVIHFAALKAVAESVQKPLQYYTNNLTGTINLLNAMKMSATKKFIFSSSATVYGDETPPFKETDPKGEIKNPYGRTKSMIEDILIDLHKSDPSWGIGILRYFNPIGADPSGLLGENPGSFPQNLMPHILSAASGSGRAVQIFGDDYDTPDGTCIRDYLHVQDLALGHINMAEKLLSSSGLHIYNLGTGKGYSVLEIIRTFEKVTGKGVAYEFSRRRPGDVATSWSDAGKAKKELGWEAKRTLEDMCRDSWKWEVNRQNET